VNCYNTNPVAGHSTAFLFQDRDGVAQPAAAMGMANAWDVLKTEPFLSLWPEGPDPHSKDIHGHGGRNQVFFAWSDLNADARVQPDEVWMEQAVCGGVTVMDDLSFCIARLNDQAVRFPVAKLAESFGGVRNQPKVLATFATAGVPVYERSKRVVLADSVQRPGSSGGDQVLADDSDEAVMTLGVEPFHRHSLSGTRDGKPVWSYPSPWPGLHASHEAASPSFPGQVIGSTRLMGGLFEVKGCEVGPLWAVNANMGNFYLFTRDGLFVATVFEDVRQGKLWKMPVATRGMPLQGISLRDENFWPTISSTSEGKVYAVDGSYSSLVRLEGLDTIRRIDAFSVEVTAEHLVEAQRWVLARETQRQAEFGRGVFHAAIHRWPARSPLVRRPRLVDRARFRFRGVPRRQHSRVVRVQRSSEVSPDRRSRGPIASTATGGRKMGICALQLTMSQVTHGCVRPFQWRRPGATNSTWSSLAKKETGISSPC